MNGVADGKIIDVHAHIVLKELTRDFGGEAWRPEIHRVKEGQIIQNKLTVDGHNLINPPNMNLDRPFDKTG